MSLELEIQNLLGTLHDTDRVADELIRRWGTGLVNEDDLNTIASFLLHCEYYPTILDLCINNLKADKPIPWKYFSEALKVIVDKLDYSIVDAIHQDAESHGHLEDLAMAKTLHPLEPGLKQIRSEHFEKRWQDYQQQKNQIDEQLQFLRSQRMLDREKELIERFALLFPGAKEVQQAEQNFEERWAVEIVQRKIEQPSEMELSPKEDPEVEKVRRIIGENAIETARQCPEQAYDIAMALTFIESWEDALSALKFSPESHAQAWLRLELLLPARRFIDALNEVSQLETNYSDLPETTFAATYYRAKALYGAGQIQSAIDLMKSLVSLRPNYRSASMMLAEWSSK